MSSNNNGAMALFGLRLFTLLCCSEALGLFAPGRAFFCVGSTLAVSHKPQQSSLALQIPSSFVDDKRSSPRPTFRQSVSAFLSLRERIKARVTLADSPSVRPPLSHWEKANFTVNVRNSLAKHCRTH